MAKKKTTKKAASKGASSKVSKIDKVQQDIYLFCTQSRHPLTTSEIQTYLSSLGVEHQVKEHNGKQVSFKCEYKGEKFVAPKKGLFTVEN